jgi:hypothetical protein
MDLWSTKWRWGRFSQSTSVSPANLHSTNFSTVTITYHLGPVQQASSGRSTKRLSLTPLRIKKKKEDGLMNELTNERLSASPAQGQIGGFHSYPASKSSSIRQCSKNINIPSPKTGTLQTGPKKQNGGFLENGYDEFT